MIQTVALMKSYQIRGKQEAALDANENIADGLRSADNKFKPSQPWSLDNWKDTNEYVGEQHGKNETDAATGTLFKLVGKIRMQAGEPLDWGVFLACFVPSL